MADTDPPDVAVATDTGSLDVSLYGRELLAALAQFMAPIRQKVGKEAVGKNLLSALEAFITARIQVVSEANQAGFEGIIEDVVSGATGSHELADTGAEESTIIDNLSAAVETDMPTDDKHITSKEQHMRESDFRAKKFKMVDNLPPTVETATPTDNKVASLNELQMVPRLIPLTDLETLTLTAVQRQVYNRMPIRMLAFDSHGDNISIIERSEIFSRFLPQVQARIASREFQEDWSEARKLKNTVYGNFRRDRMNELLDGAIVKVAKYGILSHTWIRTSPGEIIFGKWEQRMKYPEGYSKVVNFCRVAARHHGLTLGWIDSLCINKDSSSELDESIRSMYNWYRRAFICITFLSETQTLNDDHKDSWYTRGWTLQELLAPRETYFYSQTWRRLGSTQRSTVRAVVTKHTGIIDKELRLFRKGDTESIPLSRRMQMACGRQVTREEDTSYSLMGLLGVEIIISYGEGSERAFYRLIAQILATKKDIVDIFNHQYQLSTKLIPTSLELYRHRNSFWDNYKSAGGTTINYFEATQPIILTHLGIRVPVLLIPALLATPGKPYNAKGDFYGQTTATYYFTDGSTKNHTYNILDKRLYADNPGELVTHAARTIHVAGVINFGHDNADNILILGSCASIALHWDGLEEGNLFSPKDIGLSGTGMSMLPISSVTNPDQPYVVPRDKLVDHGMQLVTLYL